MHIVALEILLDRVHSHQAGVLFHGLLRQVLVDLGVILREVGAQSFEERVIEAHEISGRAIILVQRGDRGVGVLQGPFAQGSLRERIPAEDARQLVELSHFAIAPAVDGLLGIAYQKDLSSGG